MVSFDNLEPLQKQALVDAFGSPSEYELEGLREIDDPVEAAEYDVFRDSLEGQKVVQGDMDDETFDSYMNIGVLREEDGDVVVNSVWQPGHVERLYGNDMLDSNSVEMYEVETRDDMKVVRTDEGFSFDIRDGSLRYNLDEADSLESAEEGSREKVEEITKDFIEAVTDVQREEIDDTGYSKSEGKLIDGGETMTDEEYDVPMTAAHAVAYESHQNLDRYDDLLDEDIDNLDVHEKVRLGTAAVIKGIEEDEYTDFGFSEVAEFVDSYGEDLMNAAKDYKAQMGGDQYDTDIPGRSGDAVDETNELKGLLEIHNDIWEALYREKAADNDESQEVIRGVLEEVSRLDRDDSGLESSRQGLEMAEDIERSQSQKADDIDDLARNL